MPDESPFDLAWEQWRGDLTAGLLAAGADLGPAVAQALADVEAFDPADGLVRRQWVLGLLTEEAEQIRPLIALGLNDGQIAGLVACIRRHPLPAAGG